MKCYVAFGSNLGDRRGNLERAARAVASLGRGFRAAAVYETPALVPAGAPADWRISYLNSVARLEWDGSAAELLRQLKKIEAEMGRGESARWAPRLIDLDLLVFGDQVIAEPGLSVPHPEMMKRSFVLDPLKDLDAKFAVPARQLKSHAPWIMGILNVTPDSFSDGGETLVLEDIAARMELMDSLGVHAIDVGAESTRPGATAVSVEEERHRLEAVFQLVRERFSGRNFKPALSIDTRRPAIAAQALEFGFTCVNDVGGLSDPAMLDLIAQHTCDYVLMHSLTIPADPKAALPANCDPVFELKDWLAGKLELLAAKGIDSSRIIFDPGIGFGKTATQSFTLLRRMSEFADLPVRILAGHSRKSFLKQFSLTGRKDTDAATLAVSLALARQGVDILRVHNFESHMAAFKVGMELQA